MLHRREQVNQLDRFQLRSNSNNGLLNPHNDICDIITDHKHVPNHLFSFHSFMVQIAWLLTVVIYDCPDGKKSLKHFS